jgi:UDPglucose 6-dehydrogenase
VNAPSERIAVFGLGKLGAVIAACHASRGFRVMGVDVDRDVVARVADGRPPVEEPGIDALFASCEGRLSATADADAAVRASDVSLVVVPTPSEPDGSYSLRHARAACEAIGRALRGDPRPHLVVMKSTVLPGACERELVPALERASARRVGRDLHFCYAPEFVALGSVVRNVFAPDLVLIGESGPAAGEWFARVSARIVDGARPTARMAIANAELTKLALNAFVTTKITFANLLAQICERLPGGDVDAVTGALGLDGRIGARALQGGLGYGGPCFPRDNHALLCLARSLDVPFPIAEATDAANRALPGRVASQIAARTPAGGRVAVLGLSYKPATAVVEESQGLQLAAGLAARGFEVTASDPLALEAARAELGDAIKYAESADACAEGADVVVIATPWPELRAAGIAAAEAPRRPLVVDCFDLLHGVGRDDGRIWRLGRASLREGGTT